jgi:3-deoxy-D-manno-octulosonic-acid transferase
VVPAGTRHFLGQQPFGQWRGPQPDGGRGAGLGHPARTARAVASASDLAEALGDLLAPDRAARLAQAAWIVASDGAEATEAVLSRLRALVGTG